MITVDTIIHILEDKKAEGIVTLNLNHAFVDHMVVATATSNRQMVTIADALVMHAKEQGLRPMVDGGSQSDWIVVDLGDALVHLFKPEARSYYNIEKMWGHSATAD